MRTQYEVEDILAQAYVHDNPYFKVKWKGYPIEEATWEEQKNLNNLKSHIKKYSLKKHPLSQFIRMIKFDTLEELYEYDKQLTYQQQQEDNEVDQSQPDIGQQNSSDKQLFKKLLKSKTQKTGLKKAAKGNLFRDQFMYSSSKRSSTPQKNIKGLQSNDSNSGLVDQIAEVETSEQEKIGKNIKLEKNENNQNIMKNNKVTITRINNCLQQVPQLIKDDTQQSAPTQTSQTVRGKVREIGNLLHNQLQKKSYSRSRSSSKKDLIPTQQLKSNNSQKENQTQHKDSIDKEEQEQREINKHQKGTQAIQNNDINNDCFENDQLMQILNIFPVFLPKECKIQVMARVRKFSKVEERIVEMLVKADDLKSTKEQLQLMVDYFLRNLQMRGKPIILDSIETTLIK